LSSIRTVTRRPGVVFARAMHCRAMSTVWQLPPLAGAGDRREHAVVDRLVLGTVWGIVGHPHLQSQPIRQLLEVFLQQGWRGAGAAAPVAQHQQPLRLGRRRAPCVLPPQRHAVAT
jgi:hypothetical protein